jgi:hypothetical protein
MITPDFGGHLRHFEIGVFIVLVDRDDKAIDIGGV